MKFLVDAQLPQDMANTNTRVVIPANAGIQPLLPLHWIPAFAGMTGSLANRKVIVGQILNAFVFGLGWPVMRSVISLICGNLPLIVAALNVSGYVEIGRDQWISHG